MAPNNSSVLNAMRTVKLRGFPFFRPTRNPTMTELGGIEDERDHGARQSRPLLAKLMGTDGYASWQRGMSVRKLLPIFLVFLIGFTLLGYFEDRKHHAVQKPPLKLTANDTFHISVFSDLHYGEDEHSFGIEQDRKSTALMRNVLDEEKPDFVVLNGDLITGDKTFAFNSTKYVDRVVAPLVEGKYSWASTYGNHDSKYNLSREKLYAREKTYDESYTGHGPPGTDGVTNYVLQVYRFDSPKKDAKPIGLLWFLDSRGGAEYQHEPPNVDNIPSYVSNGTVSWYRQAQADLQSKFGILPSLVLIHIPSHAFFDLQNQKNPKVSSDQYPGLNGDIPLFQQGSSNTGIESVPLMKALLDTPGLHSVYSAHDHEESWCGRWPNASLPGYGVGGGSSKDRPFLCFCRHSGYGGYGDSERGVRQVRIAIDAGGAMSVDTWVRMQSGRVITAVSLNETYGKDVYPTEDYKGQSTGNHTT